MEILARFGLPVDYCRPCRLKHEGISKRREIEDSPLCEITEGRECEYIQHATPYRLHPSNWLPLLIYEQALRLSNVESILAGDTTQTRVKLSPQSLALVMEVHCDGMELSDVDFVLEAVGIINQTFEHHSTDILLTKAREEKKG